MATGNTNTSPSSKSTTEGDPTPQQELSVKVLLWNIHGKGIAKARHMLVEEVVKKTNPDIVLLQEVAAEITVTRAEGHSKSNGREYEHHLTVKKSLYEAGIMYDTERFESTELNLTQLIAMSNLSGRVTQLELRGQQLTGDQKYYSDRTCALRLHSSTSGEMKFVVVSFHNCNKRWHKVAYAEGFLKLVELIYQHEKVPVIAGGDFNCDCRELIYEQEKVPVIAGGDFNCDCREHEPPKDTLYVLNYFNSKRRKGENKIDFFIVRPHPPPTITRKKVEVFEALPLSDPKSNAATNHPLGIPVLKRLKDDAPRKTILKKITLEEFSMVSNHDPTVGEFTITKLADMSKDETTKKKKEGV